MTTSITTSTTSNPNVIVSQNHNMHSDHYQYLRTLLPPIPHVIEKLSFTDLNSWGCSINLALLTSTDCLKWLAEFQEITKTEWKVEKNLSINTATGGNGDPNISWGVIYRCDPSSKKNNGHSNPNQSYSKDCTARLEMKITNTHQNQQDPTIRISKQYPCTVNIHFYHNHKTVTSFPSSSSFSTTYTLPTSSSTRELHTTNVHVPAATTTASITNDINNGMINNHHQNIVDSTSDNRIHAGQQQHQNHTNTISSSDATTSSPNTTTASYSHIQELKMNDAYMVNALTEAAVATRAAVAAKSVQQQQRNGLSSRKHGLIIIFRSIEIIFMKIDSFLKFRTVELKVRCNLYRNKRERN